MKRLFIPILTVLILQDLCAQNINARTFAYESIDSFILSLNQDRFNSPEEFAVLINTNYKSDIEKMRAIFRWVTNNISYDGNANPDPLCVFKTKKAVCQGYSELIKYLCDLSQVECIIVSGIAKNDIEYLDHPVDTVNHAWNIVKLSNRKYLLDATWAAGSVNEDTREFKKEFQGEYYLTIPETFILQHLPANPDHQFLIKKVAAEDFINGPSFYDGAIKCNLTACTPQTATINTTKGSLTNFNFEMKKPISELGVEILDDSNENYVAAESPVNFSQTYNKVNFQVEFEDVGLFYLVIYIDNEQAIYYKVDVKK